ncbi:primosomal protein N' [Thioalkalivibrio sp. HK1]|uniref:primosomal protein N' n=1 Tax=Thioalkalivibrio sp. HK1 TaxID=1469245 RepID=UPI0004AF3358|nr:primosomal protein N' [Thioalkalivibrio sp. HK1]
MHRLAKTTVMAEAIIQVAVPTPLRRHFDYLPPLAIPGSFPIRSGMRVRVPFGRTAAIGIVIGIARKSDLPITKLKRVLDVLDEEPLLDQSMLDLLRWASGYFQHPVGEVVVGTLPRLLRMGRGLHAFACDPEYSITVAGERALHESSLSAAPVQERLLRLIRDHAGERAGGNRVREQALKEAFVEAGIPNWRRPLQALIDKGTVVRERDEGIERTDAAAGKKCDLRKTPVPHAEIPRLAQPQAKPCDLTPSPLRMNADQIDAADAISAQIGLFAPFLLEGVTGSGKTEVYLRAIEEVVAAGRQALVLIPEIGLTPQLIARFGERLSCQVQTLHSGLSDGERLAAWTSARDGQAQVVVGTRSAVFVPLARPGLIVVDEEHDLSYKQQEGFRYSARDLAVMRARNVGVPVVLASATPSLEAIENVRRGRYRHLVLSHRAGHARMPRIDVVDLRSRPFAQGLSDPLIEAIEDARSRREQVLLFVNRRGYAPRYLCHGCGWIADCSRCDAQLVLHHADRRLRCHHCFFEQPLLLACPECGCEDLRSLGIGTERVAQALEARIEGLRVARMDRDSTRRRGALESLLAQVHSGEVDALVGTQMLAKGHHFPNVTVVAILDADGGLFGVDFRSTERMAQLLIQVAGRAGRGDRPGRVILQTHHPQHPLLRGLILEGYRTFCDGALDERRRAHLPPYANLALVRAEAMQRRFPEVFLKEAAAGGRARAPTGISILGPAPAPMERRAGRWRTQLLIEASSRSALQRFLGPWIETLEALPSARRVRWSVDVDPQEMV